MDRERSPRASPSGSTGDSPQHREARASAVPITGRRPALSFAAAVHPAHAPNSSPSTNAAVAPTAASVDGSTVSLQSAGSGNAQACPARFTTDRPSQASQLWHLGSLFLSRGLLTQPSWPWAALWCGMQSLRLSPDHRAIKRHATDACPRACPGGWRLVICNAPNHIARSSLP